MPETDRLCLDDNEANQMNSICVRRLGIISLQCHRIKVLDSIVRTSYDPEPVLEDTLVHERRKTLGGHRILCVPSIRPILYQSLT